MYIRARWFELLWIKGMSKTFLFRLLGMRLRINGTGRVLGVRLECEYGSDSRQYVAVEFKHCRATYISQRYDGRKIIFNLRGWKYDYWWDYIKRLGTYYKRRAISDFGGYVACKATNDDL